MFCLYTLPLARPAQAKVQMLTNSSCIVKSIPWNLVNLSHLYRVFAFLQTSSDGSFWGITTSHMQHGFQSNIINGTLSNHCRRSLRITIWISSWMPGNVNKKGMATIHPFKPRHKNKLIILVVLTVLWVSKTVGHMGHHKQSSCLNQVLRAAKSNLCWVASFFLFLHANEN